ncbi:MAG: ATP-binding cassette domain-containing protein [Sulfolobales archaeon]
MRDLLRTENLYAGVENKVIIEAVNIRVGYGETVAVLGPNGSGKSTLLRALAGYPKIRVFKGSIYFEDEEITSKDPLERNMLGIVLMHQNPPRLRGVRIRVLLDKILSRELKSISEREKEINRVAESLEIKHLLDREFGHGLSGGEMKRVELATVILQRPRLALIDEPDSGVDVDSLFIIASAINTLLRENSGLILVTHTGGIARYVNISRAYVMISGRVITEGPGREVFDKLFTEGFKGFMR